MTISLKADASGNSGSIQVSGNDKLIVNADGSLIAAVNPATGETVQIPARTVVTASPAKALKDAVAQ